MISRFIYTCFWSIFATCNFWSSSRSSLCVLQQNMMMMIRSIVTRGTDQLVNNPEGSRLWHIATCCAYGGLWRSLKQQSTGIDGTWHCGVLVRTRPMNEGQPDLIQNVSATRYLWTLLLIHWFLLPRRLRESRDETKTAKDMKRSIDRRRSSIELISPAFVPGSYVISSPFSMAPEKTEIGYSGSSRSSQ